MISDQRDNVSADRTTGAGHGALCALSSSVVCAVRVVCLTERSVLDHVSLRRLAGEREDDVHAAGLQQREALARRLHRVVVRRRAQAERRRQTLAQLWLHARRDGRRVDLGVAERELDQRARQLAALLHASQGRRRGRGDGGGDGRGHGCCCICLLCDLGRCSAHALSRCSRLRIVTAAAAAAVRGARPAHHQTDRHDGHDGHDGSTHGG